MASKRLIDRRILNLVRSNVSTDERVELILGERTNMKMKYVILLGAAMLLAGALFAQDLPSAGTGTQAPTLGAGAGQPQAPFSEKDVITELKKKGNADQLIKDLGSRGVDFEMDADSEKRLRHAKATDAIIAAVKAAGPKERAAALKASAIASGMTLVSKEESADFKTMETELDPDKQIALAEAYVQKYPKSDIVSYAYAFEANAYENKGDAAKIVEYADKSLAIKKDNMMALLMDAYAIPQPQYVKLHQADEEKQLDRAEGLCKDAMAAIDALKKTDNESDADFAERKGGYTSNIHADLGMIHLDRAQLGLLSIDRDELVKAVQEYNEAVSYSHPQSTDYYRLGEANRLLGKTDDAIAAFTKARDLGQGVLKQYADAQIANLQKAKAGAPKP
jgi:tetratricopeptide (TPR) repeat protein